MGLNPAPGMPAPEQRQTAISTGFNLTNAIENTIGNIEKELDCLGIQLEEAAAVGRGGTDVAAVGAEPPSSEPGVVATAPPSVVVVELDRTAEIKE